MSTRQPEASCHNAGFTLIELLTVVSIIGLLSTMAMVSFESARMSSRDVKRTSDMRQLTTALELYFGSNNAYPGDGTPGPGGLVLGTGKATMLSDAGFADHEEGRLYMQRLPMNPAPNGLPYTYRGLTLDGQDCNEKACDSYAIIFALEKKSGQLEAGPHATTPIGIVGPETAAFAGVVTASGRIVGLESVQGTIGLYADTATTNLVNFVENKTVKDTTTVGVAPAAAVAAVANTAVAVNTVATGASAGQYLFFFLTQPLLLLRRRRRKHWGTVYNSLSHLPADLVIVRLRETAHNRIIRSEVTDRDGRFTFLLPQGRYRIEAVKAGFVFPSKVAAELETDGPYPDVYHGEEIEVGPEGASLNPNIPIDPAEAEVPDQDLIKQDKRRKMSSSIAIVSPILGALALAISPSMFTGALFILQLLVYAFFRRIANPGSPKNWGVVYDQQSNRPVYQAVVRIFALPYHKLMEAKVTDRLGRYNFRVGSNQYYMTATKKRYVKTETEPIDFSDTRKPMFIAADLPLRPENYVVAPDPQEPVVAGQPTADKPEASEEGGEAVQPESAVAAEKTPPLTAQKPSRSTSVDDLLVSDSAESAADEDGRGGGQAAP